MPSRNVFQRPFYHAVVLLLSYELARVYGLKLAGKELPGHVSDLDDADLMRRPGEGCNHLAWQLGHLIASEVQLLESVAPGKSAELPEGFAEAHSKEVCGNDDPQGFHNKATYVELFDKMEQDLMAA